MGSPKSIFERAIRVTKLSALISLLPSLFGQDNTVASEILVKTGDSPAGSELVLGSFEEIDFNDGLATFVADDGNGNDGIFQMTASDTFALRVIEGDPAPGITIPPANTEQANFNQIPETSFSPSVLFSADASGQVAFKAELDFFSDTLWIKLPGFDPQIVAGGAFNFPITSEATYQSGVTGASHTGHMTLMNQDIPAINQSGDLAFWGALLTDDVNVSSSGLFVRSGLAAISNILISGDPVPGQPGMFFTSASFGSSAFSVDGQKAFQNDGTLYFRASLVDDLGNPSILEHSFWRKNNSTLSLLAKEDMSAPGLDSRTMERLGLYPSNESR
ncbi:MAG: choice-of-anchor tandem repeat NxxGxxAF-containing protein, partial [Verrucomicrobiota bacterium]